MANAQLKYPHDADPDIFREALAYSEADKGFTSTLIEKDYFCSLEYHSVIAEKVEKIKIEVGIRESLLRPPEPRLASTIAMNPFSGQPLLPPFKVGAMALQEAYAEKVRAAITRKEPAIRDFFDIFHAIHKRQLDTQNPDFLAMVKAKIDVPGNDPIDLSEGRQQELNRQLEGQLKPVLRPSDYDGFNLNEAFEHVRNLTESLTL